MDHAIHATALQLTYIVSTSRSKSLDGVAAVNILLVVVMSMPALQASSDSMILVVVVMSVAINAFFIWALGQDDVREWMFRKNFNLDGVDGVGGDDDIPKL